MLVRKCSQPLFIIDVVNKFVSAVYEHKEQV
jgi:hypothetical protein